jgi:euchromatic histone-lysine N-methyltransferase
MNGSINSETVYYLWNNSIAGDPSTKRRLSTLNESGSSINNSHNESHDEEMDEPNEVTQRAKMSLLVRSSVDHEIDEQEIEVPSVSVTIPSSLRKLSSSGLPVGAVREELESILLSLTENLKHKRSSSIPETETLYSLTRANSLQGVVELLSRGSDPNSKYEEHEDETALHAAAAEGNLLILHVLIQSGANLDVINARLSTPLMEAVENDRNDCVDHLVRVGASLDFRGEDGMTAFHIASKQGNLHSVKTILESRRVDVNLQDDGGWTALIWATEHKQKNVVDYLLTKGADPMIQDDEENICLHWAAFSGDVDILSIFMQSALDINCVNKHGDTALHIASRRDNVEAVNLLCSRQDVDLNILNKNKETALDCCPVAEDGQESSSFLSLKIKMEMIGIVNNRITVCGSKTERYLHRDIAKGKERNPIPIVNAVDDEAAPSSDFVYVSANCETTGMNIDKSIGSLQACRCLNDCSLEDCNCGIISTGYWYDDNGRLKESFKYHDPPMILECNRACSCWNNCSNRVVQRGITCRLQIFKTNGKGWGLKTLKYIPKGTFVIEYVGEYITDSEANGRDDDSFLFDLDEKISVSSIKFDVMDL